VLVASAAGGVERSFDDVHAGGVNCMALWRETPDAAQVVCVTGGDDQGLSALLLSAPDLACLRVVRMGLVAASAVNALAGLAPGPGGAGFQVWAASGDQRLGLFAIDFGSCKAEQLQARMLSVAQPNCASLQLEDGCLLVAGAGVEWVQLE
jgi:hypothetical protein